MYLTPIVRRDFWKLLAVCLKMLFRKSTRMRFVCLVAAFLFTLGYNTYSYVRKYRDTAARQQQILQEQAFQTFFVRFRSPNDVAGFVKRHGAALRRQGANLIHRAFLYQNNLYIHLTAEADQRSPGEALLYRMFHLEKFAQRFTVDVPDQPYRKRIKNAYLDYNGAGLDLDIVMARDTAVKGDLSDAAALVRGQLSGRRLVAYNDTVWRMTGAISRTPPPDHAPPNPYVSRVALVIPMNYLHIFTNMARDNTTDILDYAESVRPAGEALLETETDYLKIPDAYRTDLMYWDTDLYPRYIPIYAPDFLKPRQHWMLYSDIALDPDLMETLDRLHFKGHYLFSYEKTLMIKERVNTINADMLANQTDFYITDLSIGVVFPFMISLFAFIYLKAELSFLLMFRNRIREVLAVFWLLPVLLMALVKLAVAALFWAVPAQGAAPLPAAGAAVWPMAASLLIAAVVFYPLNGWCFSQFTGYDLNLSLLHKGR